MRKHYKTFFMIAGAVMIWLGVRLLTAALSAIMLMTGALLIFVGMRVITRSGTSVSNSGDDTKGSRPQHRTK